MPSTFSSLRSLRRWKSLCKQKLQWFLQISVYFWRNHNLCLWILLIQKLPFLTHCTLKAADQAKQIKGKMRVLTVYQTCRFPLQDRSRKYILLWLSKWLQRRAAQHMARTRGTSWWNWTLKTSVNNNSHICLLITDLNFKLYIIQIASQLRSPCSPSWWLLQFMLPNILAEMCNCICSSCQTNKMVSLKWTM